MQAYPADGIDAWSVDDLAAAVRAAVAAGRPALTVALRDGGRHRLAAAARRWPFLRWHTIPQARVIAAAAAAALAPAGCRAVCVPGDGELAQAIADRLGAAASGEAGRLAGAWTVDPWSLPQVRAAVAAGQAVAIAPPSAAAPTTRDEDRRAERLRARMAALEPEIGDDGPDVTVQPERGWTWWRCPGLGAAQAAQRRLVAAGIIVRRQGRVLALPAGWTHGLPGEPATAPSPASPPGPALLPVCGCAAADPATLAARIDALLPVERIVVLAGGLPAAAIGDLAEDLRRIARLRPFLDLHLALPGDGALLALAEADRLHADLLWRGAQPDPDGLAAAIAAALDDRSLLPEPWQEVAQACAAGEAHHGGGGGEEVTVALAGMAVASLPAAAAVPSPIGPLAGMLVEPVPAGEHGTATAAALARGIRILTGLTAHDGGDGWIGIRVPEPALILRALVAQGVLARRHGAVVHLPCGAAFRPRHEIRSLLAALAEAISLLAPATTPCRGSATARPAPQPLRA